MAPQIIRAKWQKICIVGVAFHCLTCTYHDQPQIEKKDLSHFARRLSSDSFGGREAGSHYGRKTAQFLSLYYKNHGFFPAFFDANSKKSYLQTFLFEQNTTSKATAKGQSIQKKEGANVGAYLISPSSEQNIIILGAHYDHLGKGNFASKSQVKAIHNGADDNASGTAAILELARARQAKPLATNTNILFLHFDAEEKGLLGSKAFVQSKYFRPQKTLAMINLDMIGRLHKDQGLYIQGAATADKRWQQLLKESFHQANFPSDYQLHFIRGGNGPSDHSMFYQRGIPVAFFYTGDHQQYHTEQDNFEHLNIDGMLYITRMNYILIQKLLTLPRPLRYRRAKQRAHWQDFTSQPHQNRKKSKTKGSNSKK